MFPWKGLVFASLLLAIAASCDAARRLSEPVIVDGVDVSSIADSLVDSPNPPDLAALAASLPPGVNLTEAAAKLPAETKAKVAQRAMENGNATELAALAAANGVGTPELAALAVANGTGNPDSAASANGVGTPELATLAVANGTGNPDSAASASANGAGQPDLSVFTASSLSEMKLPDIPNVAIPDFSMPPLPKPRVNLFGRNFDLSPIFGRKKG